MPFLVSSRNDATNKSIIHLFFSPSYFWVSFHSHWQKTCWAEESCKWKLLNLNICSFSKRQRPFRSIGNSWGYPNFTSGQKITKTSLMTYTNQKLTQWSTLIRRKGKLIKRYILHQPYQNKVDISTETQCWEETKKSYVKLLI